MVQHPSRVGGTDDHPSWNKSSHILTIKITSLLTTVLKNVLKGDIINRMFKYFNISEACLLTFISV